MSGGTVAGVQDYYEDLWERLPAEAAGADFEPRRAFLAAAIRPGDRALDLGAGGGDFTAVLAQAGASVVGVEVAEAAVRRARARHPALDFRVVAIDGELPFQDCAFDLVWASEVIEHVADTARWLSEVRRVLAPAGRLLVTTPSHGRLRIAVGGVERFSDPLGDHLHLYTKRSLRAVLGEFGFASVRIRSVGGLPGLRQSLWATAVR
jgi:ubiquinone/menaquinone biosynthesis C-methylase UbiE